MSLNAACTGEMFMHYNASVGHNHKVHVWISIMQVFFTNSSVNLLLCVFAHLMYMCIYCLSPKISLYKTNPVATNGNLILQVYLLISSLVSFPTQLLY